MRWKKPPRRTLKPLDRGMPGQRSVTSCASIFINSAENLGINGSLAGAGQTALQAGAAGWDMALSFKENLFMEFSLLMGYIFRQP